MKFEKVGSISYKKGILVGVILAFLLVVVINLFTSLAKYRLTESVKIVDSVVSYSPYDFKIMEIYKQKEGSNCTDINGECYDKLTSSERMPSDGYILNSDNSYCNLSDDNIDNEATLTSNESGETVISGLTVKDKCYLYYDKEMKAGDTIVANSNVLESDAHFDGTACLTDCTYKENGLYKAEDDFGESYYFRGTVNNNWVQFGNMGGTSSGNKIYWRIIRINGDGSIRLIYAGNGTSGTNLSESDGRIGSTNNIFNASYTDNRFVGYQFGESGTQRGHTNPSSAYNKLKDWFENNLKEEFENQNSKIDRNTGFCGDRSSSIYSHIQWSETMSEKVGTGFETTYYGAYLRLESRLKQPTPTFKCGTNGHKNEDYYTYQQAKEVQSTSNEKIKGSQSLEYPVGLINADEVAFAGGYNGLENKNYWLYTGVDYWTISPSYYYDSVYYACMFIVDSNGNLAYNSVYNPYGLRPVINLKANTQLTFQNSDGANKGTSSNPYIVVE